MANKKFRYISNMGYVLLTCSIIVFSSPSIGQQAKDTFDSKMFRIVKIGSDDKLSIRNYTLSAEVINIDLSELDLTDYARNYLSNGRLFTGESIPDFKLILLEKGYATLKTQKKHSAIYSKAQEDAEKAHVGIWKLPTLPSQKPTPESASNSNNFNWSQFFGWLIGIIFTVVSLFGGSALIEYFNRWKRRNRVSLILVGRPATGKSWLWSRLIDPTISDAEQLRIMRNPQTKKKISCQAKLMGPYEITPVYTDVPGGDPGQQVDAFFQGKKVNNGLDRFLKPNKSVWIIMLSTTPDEQVTFSSNDNLKIDRSYIDQQLGHLDLPIGIIKSNDTPSPCMVILCMSKFDLFSSTPPNIDQNSKNAQSMLSNTFGKHIEAIKDTCKGKGIPFEIIFCSASKENWGAEKILGYVERALLNK